MWDDPIHGWEFGLINGMYFSREYSRLMEMIIRSSLSSSILWTVSDWWFRSSRWWYSFTSVFVDGGITITAPPVLCSRWIHATQLWERCTCDTHYIISWNICQAVHSCCFYAACDSCPPLYLVVFPPFVWTAPEVLGGGPYNHAADWWSLGIMLFSLVTGEVKANEYVNVSITGRTDLCTHTHLSTSEYT